MHVCWCVWRWMCVRLCVCVWGVVVVVGQLFRAGRPAAFQFPVGLRQSPPYTAALPA